MKSVHLSVRIWLLLLAVVAALPLALLSTYTIVELGNFQQQSLTENLVRRGEATASAIDQRLDTVAGALVALSITRAAQIEEYEALYGNAQRLLGKLPQIRAVSLIAPDGTMIFNTLRPFGSPLPPAYDQASARQVFEAGKPVVSGPFKTQFSDATVVSVGVPVVIGDKVAYCLRGILLTDAFVEALRDQHLPEEWVATIIDQAGTIVARTHQPEVFVGKKVSPTLQQALAEKRQGVFDAVTLEGVPVKTVTARGPSWDWTIAMGVPTAILAHPLAKSLTIIGAGTALLLTIGILVALWFSRQLSTFASPQHGVSAPHRPEAATERAPQALVRALPLVRYVVAVAIFGTALAARMAILPAEAGLGFLTFYPATAFAALLCGTGPGLMVAALGGITAHYAFMAPYWTFKFPIPYQQWVPEVPYLLSGVVICMIVHRMRSHARAVRDANIQLTAEVEERRKVEAKLAVSLEDLKHSNQELDEFAYIASHDLKEPLRGIHNYASFLKEDYADRLDDEGRNYLDRMQRLAERLSDLIDRLLAYSRLGSSPLSLEVVDANAVLDEVAEDLKQSLADRGVELRRAGPLPAVTGNALRLGEVFQNLIVNAAKYNDKAEKWVEVGCDTSGAIPVFYVRDNGIGIPEQHRETVFRLFKRLHEQTKFGGGTGAGLTIIKKIIERHSGHIWLESTPGEGTTFHFTLSGEHP